MTRLHGKRRRWTWIGRLLAFLPGVLLGVALVGLSVRVVAAGKWKREPIRVGVLHSLSGTMATSERSVRDATLLAIEEINEAGGILGRPIQPFVADGKSDWGTFAREAERLIAVEKVSVVFGCWTSASRKTVRPIFEKYDHLLFYPVQYEGLERSPNIVYMGAAPNQQILPAVKWCCEHLGKRFFLVGSDYVFPRTANAIIRDQVAALRGEVVGEAYLPLGSTDVSSVVREIRAARPDVVLNTINGDTNVEFFRELWNAGITPAEIPVMSFSIGETELASLDPTTVAGNYAAWNYFQSIDNPENRAFVASFRRRYGSQRVTSDPMEAAYCGVHLWAQAVAEAQSVEPVAVRRALVRQSFAAPEGRIYLDSSNQHTWKTVRIGRIRSDGQFDVVWTSTRLVRPVPYPVYRSKSEWDAFLVALYDGWHENWANLGR